MAGQFSPQEQAYYNKLFDVVDKEKLGVLPGDASITFLLTSGLPQRTLGEIWALCDPNNTGYLTRDGWWKACRLIGWAQKGEPIKAELTSRSGAFPRFDGQDPPPSTTAPVSSMTPQLTGAGSATAHPPLTPADRTQFTRLFVSSNPVNGLLPATQAQTIFIKSGLPTETLAQIWNLADTQQRGSLDLPDFILAMYFIQHTMAGAFKSLPPVLPAGLYEQASGGRPKPPPLPTSPIARQMTGNMPPTGSPTPSMITRQMTGSGAPIQPQRTGQGYSVPPVVPSRQFSGSSYMPSQPAQQAWDIKSEEKQAADSFFDGLDTTKRGFIEGDVAVPFMLQSGLPEGVLAQIWDLADIRKEGKLNKDEFAVALYLINKKLGGIEVPTTLPNSLIPPSLRGGAEQQPSQTQKDLFDLFADSPPAAAGPTQQTQAQTNNYFTPPLSANPTGQGRPQRAHLPGGAESFGPSSFGGDLMGDDETPSPAVSQPQAKAPPARSLSAIQPQVTGPKASERDYSADIGNAKLSLESTTRGVEGLQREKVDLEQKESAAASQLKEIELRLSSVRAQHDNETRIVDDLKRRTNEQAENLKKLRADLITSESELSALRAEKDETEQALLRDKEEVRTMGKRMKEVQEETEKLKALLEKMKKEARQQRGMVAIAKKQVQTVEGTRDTVQREMDDVAAGKGIEEPIEHLPQISNLSRGAASPEPTGIMSPGNVNTAASIPLPATPQRALSPVATGNASRSNNPFDRLGFGSASTTKPPAVATGSNQAFFNAFAQQPEAQEPLEQSNKEIQSSVVDQQPKDDDSHLSMLQKAALGVGAVATAATAGVLAVGGAAGSVISDAGAAVRSGVEHVTDPASEKSAEPSAADTMHEIAENVKEDNASPEPHQEMVTDLNTPPHQDDVISPFNQEDAAQNLVAESPAEHQVEDPFGMSSSIERRNSDRTPTAETSFAQAGPLHDDPFGMPPMASTGGYVEAKDAETHFDSGDKFESNFNEGFNDDFGKEAGITDDNAAHITSPTADMHLAPASEPRGEFDSAFADAEKPAPAIPPQLRGLMAPGMPERTASTRAEASSSTVGTPLSEFAPSTPRSIDTESPVPVDVPALAPIPPSTDDQDEDDDRLRSVAGMSSAARSVDPESSEDELDGPEDLDRSRSPFSGIQHKPHSDSEPEADMLTPAQQRENPISNLANLGLGAPIDETHAQSSIHTDDFAQAGDVPSAPTTMPERRRDPPPPPVAKTSMGMQSSNPFASFASGSPGPTIPSAPTGAFTPANEQKQETSASSFDDDFDFENLPSAQVSHDQAHASADTRQTSTDFDDEFDDFGNDFEEIQPASRQKQPMQSNVHNASGAPQLPGFDNNFGLEQAPAFVQAQPSSGLGSQQVASDNNTDKGFGFDDDFGSAAFTSVPQVQAQQNHTSYAPPSGPPPPQSQAGQGIRPDLPARQSVSRAQPDDLDDVKKLCNMGFDRSLVIDALEANGYDFSKTLNVLLT
ncbi:hypothetical protein QFC22_005939 [Naganishia vaughanmartiniae]|uniref:Uncharacterized protein n=1 Tax=Naganishia vaughanmartiniae TaxID=1424756 RepID=A0ACC2WQF1_9TREE|nr:hypothetical protein QFC22_005939 [Naganishia vaughanmartiniae]